MSGQVLVQQALVDTGGEPGHVEARALGRETPVGLDLPAARGDPAALRGDAPRLKVVVVLPATLLVHHRGHQAAP